MTIIGLALMAGAIGVLVGFREELGLRWPAPRQRLAWWVAGLVAVAAVRWRPGSPARRRPPVRPVAGRTPAPGNRSPAAPMRPARRPASQAVQPTSPVVPSRSRRLSHTGPTRRPPGRRPV